MGVLHSGVGLLLCVTRAELVQSSIDASELYWVAVGLRTALSRISFISMGLYVSACGHRLDSCVR